MNCWFMHTGVTESWWNDGIKLLLTVNVKLCMYVHIYILYISKTQQIAIINFICTTLVLKNMKYIFVFSIMDPSMVWQLWWKCGSYNENVITMTSKWTQWRLKPPASRLSLSFNRLFRRWWKKHNKKHQSSASLTFVRELTGDQWIPRTNGQ